MNEQSISARPSTGEVDILNRGNEAIQLPLPRAVSRTVAVPKVNGGINRKATSAASPDLIGSLVSGVKISIVVMAAIHPQGPEGSNRYLTFAFGSVPGDVARVLIKV